MDMDVAGVFVLWFEDILRISVIRLPSIWRNMKKSFQMVSIDG